MDRTLARQPLLLLVISRIRFVVMRMGLTAVVRVGLRRPRMELATECAASRRTKPKV